MFDVGFSELVVIGLVALIVIGPERLPKVARTAGLLLGRLQRYVNDVKADINREMQLDELKKLQEQVADQARAMESTLSQEMSAVETSLNQSIAPPAVEVPAAEAPPSAPAETPLEARAEVPAEVSAEASSPADQMELGLGQGAEKAKT